MFLLKHKQKKLVNNLHILILFDFIFVLWLFRKLEFFYFPWVEHGTKHWYRNSNVKGIVTSFLFK
jgi:hypothetical protein